MKSSAERTVRTTEEGREGEWRGSIDGGEEKEEPTDGAIRSVLCQDGMTLGGRE